MGSSTAGKSRKLFCFMCFLLLVGIVALVGFLVLNVVIAFIVRGKVVIVNGTDTFEQWLSPTVPVQMEIYVYNLTNAEEVMNGEKPFFVQLGPYVYRERRIKYDLQWAQDDSSVVYKQNRTFIFDPSLSVGSDTDMFVTANVPLLTVTSNLRYKGELLSNLLSTFLILFPSEKLLYTRSIRDVIWGYEDPLLKFAKKWLPTVFSTDFVGILTGMNATYDGIYRILTGVADVNYLGRIDEFNGSKSLHFWSTPWANMINGTDGSLAPPGLTHNSVLEVFVSDICRSVYADYDQSVTARVDANFPLWRFTGPRRLYLNASLNPDNAGFCTPAGNCNPSGLLNLSTCKSIDGFSLPIVVSQPHFLDADPSVTQELNGLPVADNNFDRNWLHVEPTTGIVMEIYRRLQINVFMEKVDGFSQLGNVRTMYFPIMWLNETAIIDKTTLGKLKPLFFMRDFVKYSLLALTIFGLGGGVLCLFYYCVIRARFRDPERQCLINTDNEAPVTGDGGGEGQPS